MAQQLLDWGYCIHALVYDTHIQTCSSASSHAWHLDWLLQALPERADDHTMIIAVFTLIQKKLQKIQLMQWLETSVADKKQICANVHTK